MLNITKSNTKFILLLSFILLISLGLSGCDTDMIDDIEDVDYDLTINVEGEGSVVPEEGTYEYDEGATAELEVSPADGFYFEEWAGNDGDKVEYDSEEDIYKIIMNSDKEITAVFEEATFERYSFIDGNQTFHDEVNDRLEFVIRLHDRNDEPITDEEAIELTNLVLADEDKTEDANIEFSKLHDEIADWKLTIDNVSELPSEEEEMKVNIRYNETDTVGEFHLNWEDINLTDEERYEINVLEETDDVINPGGSYYNIKLEITNVGNIAQEKPLGLFFSLLDNFPDGERVQHLPIYFEVVENLQPGESMIFEEEIAIQDYYDFEQEKYDLEIALNYYDDQEYIENIERVPHPVTIGDEVQGTEFDESEIETENVNATESENQTITFEFSQIRDDNALGPAEWIAIGWYEDQDNFPDDVDPNLISGLEDLKEQDEGEGKADVNVKAGGESLETYIIYAADEENTMSIYFDQEGIDEKVDVGEEVTIEIEEDLDFSQAESGDYKLGLWLFERNAHSYSSGETEFEVLE